MFSIKKTKSMLKYLIGSSTQELEKEKHLIEPLRNQIPLEYREVFDYIYDDECPLSESSKIIYKELL
jgi:hypothetical protein